MVEIFFFLFQRPDSLDGQYYLPIVSDRGLFSFVLVKFNFGAWILWMFELVFLIDYR